jgi:hypothetical protein
MGSFMDNNLFYFYFTLSTFSRHTILDEEEEEDIRPITHREAREKS